MPLPFPFQHAADAGLGLGPRGWIKTTALTLRMLRVMGWRWFASYLAAPIVGVGSTGVRALDAMVAACNAGDADALAALGGADAMVETWKGSDALRALPSLLDPALKVSGTVCAGQTVTFRYTVGGRDDEVGIGIVEFGAGARVRRARFFPGHAG